MIPLLYPFYLVFTACAKSIKLCFPQIRIPFILMLAIHFAPHWLFAQQKTVGLTQFKNGTAGSGYILFAPMGSKTTYLINKCGRKINEWRSDYAPGLSAYLLNDGSLLRTGILNDTFYVGSGKGGILERFDWSGKRTWSYRISNDSLAQHHDIHPMENGNILVIAWHGISAARAELRGRIKGTVGGPKLWSERILELKPKGTDDAEVVWQWSLSDHLIQDASLSKPDYNTISQHPELMNINYTPVSGPDWIHMNGLDYNRQLDQIAISCHNNSEIWIIDHSTSIAEAAGHTGGNSGMGGDILYRWGNPAAYNKGLKTNQKLFQQHNARWIPAGYKDEGNLMVFNNGLGRSPAYSTVEIIEPPVMPGGSYNRSLPYGPSQQKWIYKDSVPGNFYSAVISGAERLPNGHTLVCSGNQGRFFEIDNKDKMVWQYVNPVEQGDKIVSDGSLPSGNTVFKCVYYPEDFQGFKGKDLIPGSPVEKNSFPYDCPPVYRDLQPPVMLTTFPAHRSKEADTATALILTFNEPVFPGKGKGFTVFENNRFKQAFTTSEPVFEDSGNKVIFHLAKPFTSGSFVHLEMDAGFVTDTAGNPCKSLDSSSWQFSVQTHPVNVLQYKFLNRVRLFPNPASSSILIQHEGLKGEIYLFDMQGKKADTECISLSPSERILHLNNLPAGKYLIHLDSTPLGIVLFQKE